MQERFLIIGCSKPGLIRYGAHETSMAMGQTEFLLLPPTFLTAASNDTGLLQFLDETKVALASAIEGIEET